MGGAGRGVAIQGLVVRGDAARYYRGGCPDDQALPLAQCRNRMLIGLPALESTDWSRLHHAYGRATETPGHLRALLNDDPAAREQAMRHLWSAVIHQGTPWTATGPVALVVAGLLTDERIDRGESLRAALLSFLVSVAEAPSQTGLSVEELERMAAFDIEPILDAEDDGALYEDEEASQSFYARAVLGCIQVAPELMKVMVDELKHNSPRVRAHAAKGAATLAKVDSLRHHSGAIERQLLALAHAADDVDERSAHVLALGDLGVSPVAFLDDPSPAVRMCAALAPSLADDAVALGELISALERDAGSIDEWFVEKPPQFDMRPRFAVVARLVRRVEDFDKLVEAAIAVVQITELWCVDFDWGPLLAAAFSDGSGLVKTVAQRRFLTALVERSCLWDPACGNAIKWFKQAGLPYDRKLCAKKLRFLRGISGWLFRRQSS